MNEEISKSQKKKEAEQLQKTAVHFIDLSLEQLDKLPLEAPLKQAILAAKTIKSHGAKRRQAQLIGKLMRAAQYEDILAAYEQILDEDSAVTAHFHELEVWRDKLIHGGKDALTELISRYQPQDIQQLRHLIKKAVEDQLNEKNTGAAKALFRYLRGCIL